MTEGAENTSLDGLIRLAFDQLIGEVHVCLPGRIETFNETKRTATVQPMISRRYRGADTATKLAILQDVPVIEYRTTKARLNLPITLGDPVLLVMADRGIENWLGSSGATPSEPLDVRKHDFTDAFAILGGWPLLKAGLTAEPVINTAGLTVAPGVKISIGNGVSELLDIVDQLLDEVSAHFHIGFAGIPTAVPDAATLANIILTKTLLAAIKAG